jgi:pyruvate formate lyase activating enzyme
MADAQSSSTSYYSPEKLVETAIHTRPEGNIGIAFTYNEPLIGYEYVRHLQARPDERFGNCPCYERVY